MSGPSPNAGPMIDLFRRLNSYSKQHGLYQALKAFGQILKSHFILRVIDELALRMAIERVLNGIEHVHRFTRAVSVGNPREFLQAEKQEQEMAEAASGLLRTASFAGTISTIPEAGGDG
jgi:TnpA family transposase